MLKQYLLFLIIYTLIVFRFQIKRFARLIRAVQMKKNSSYFAILFHVLAVLVGFICVSVDETLGIRTYIYGWRFHIYPLLIAVFLGLTATVYVRYLFRKDGFAKKLRFGCMVVLGLVAYFWAVPYIVIRYSEDKTYHTVTEVLDAQMESEEINANVLEKSRIAIVLGAGVNPDGTPSDILKDRLIVATELYDAEIVEKVLVTGDNRWENYNEPKAMRDYLVSESKIPVEDIVLDYAGRRTYDSCMRANDLWQLDEAIVVTQEFHLHRTLYICSKVGVNVIGVSATRHLYVGDIYMKTRELFAMHKAIFDLYIKEPIYVGGEKEVIVW